MNIINLCIVVNHTKIQKYCMSHLGWTTMNSNGLCSMCGSAMLEDEDMS